MAAKIIKEWLSEYKTLPEAEINTFAYMIQNNEDLKGALYRLFEDDFTQEVVDPVCHQLFDFYRSSRADLQKFTLEFIPTLITAYLTALSRNEKKKTGGVEACLLGIYNLEIVNKDGTQREESITIPTLAVPSIYHEPPSLATLALTESALLRYHSDEPMSISAGPLPMIERLNAQNRFGALTHLLHCYNKQIALISAKSHKSYCKMATRLCKTGFENIASINGIDYTSLNDSFSSTSSRSSSRRNIKFVDEPRIPLNSQLLVEILNGIYFVMFNGQDRDGVEAVDSIHNRACYELFSDVILVTNAIKNSLMFNPSGAPEEGPMGISVALSPTSSNPGFVKHAITNASFRAKKLPDDIPEVDRLEEEPDMGPAKFSRKSSESQMSPDIKAAGLRLKGKKKPSRQSSRTDDIEVVEEGEGAPPEYNEVLDADKFKPDKFKLSKPLKSIMKTGEKIRRRESEAKKHRDGGDGHSPRQSMVVSASMTSSQSSASVNGEYTDPNMVQVSVAQGSARSSVDHIELRNLDIAHRRTTSNPEGNFSEKPDITVDGSISPDGKVMTNHSGVNGNTDKMSQHSSEHSLHTQL